MTFWNELNAAPIQQHHFAVEFGSFWKPYEVKSITMPQLEISEGQYRMGNHYYKYPGTSKWNDVVITIVDTGDAAQQIMSKLMAQGYYHDVNSNTPQVAKNKKLITDLVTIRQHRTRTVLMTKPEKKEKEGGFLSFLGFKKKESNSGPSHFMVDDPVAEGFSYGYNTWYLHSCWIKAVNFGTHDYSSDDLTTIEISIAYDWAELTQGDAQTSPLGVYRPVDEPMSPRAARKQQRIEARAERKEARKNNREARKAEREKKRRGDGG